jgi:hypothetical protein
MNFGPLDLWRPSLTTSFAKASDAAKNSELI